MEPATMWVKAGTRGPVVRPDAGAGAAGWIGDEPIEVPNNRYYRRRLEVGDLVRAETQPAEAPI